MPPRYYGKNPPAKSNTILWVVLGSVAVIGLCVGLYFAFKGSGNKGGDEPLGSGRAVLDLTSSENTRAWSADAVKRLKDGTTTRERVEKELNDAFLGKQVRWAFPVVAVADNEVQLDSFYGTSGPPFRGEGADLHGKPTRKLYFRVYFESEKDGVMVGNEISAGEASRLEKGSKWTVARTVIKTMVTKSDDTWVSTSHYSNVVDVLDAYCITIVIERK